MMNKSFPLLMISTIANGFFNLAQFSVAYEMAVHIVRHLNAGEATICGFINVLSNFIGFLLVLGLTPILTNHLSIDSIITSATFLGVLIVSFFFMLFGKSDI